MATAINSNSTMHPEGNGPISVSVDGKSNPNRQNPAPASMMVLEGAVGTKALGVFLVENGFPRAVSASASASTFVDENGNEVNPTVEFQPASIVLEPGEQMLVKVMANIDETIPAGVRYRGEIGVPGLMGTRIPVVLGRTVEARATESKKRKPNSHVGSLARTQSRVRDRDSTPRRKPKRRAAKA